MAGVLSTQKSIFASTQQSGRVGSSLSKFSRFKICFTSNPLTCGNGQVNKLSLIQFSCHRNWYTVNPNNDKVIIRYKKGGVEQTPLTINILNQDYGSVGDIATQFASQLKTTLGTAQGGTGFGGVVNQNPANNYNTGETGKRSFSMEMTSAAILTLSDIRIQCPQFRDASDPTDFNDSYVLLGGKRIADSTDTTTSSFKVTYDGNKVIIQGSFPMQLHTQPFLYLSMNVSNDNLQTANLGNINAAIDEHVTSSCFLGKIPVQTNFCAIQLDESTPYSMTTSQRSVTELLFQCLDSHGREFPLIDDANDGADIETDGNLFSDMIIRHEILDIGSDGNVLDAPYKTYNYQLNNVGAPQLVGGGGF